MMPTMLDYLLVNFYPEINLQQIDSMTKYHKMYDEVVRRTAVMVARWQLVGFCHGVLNTDNMSILGLTIDYGPFGFMEHYDPDLICNHSDLENGRYRYKAQPEICLWNLNKLAEALSLIVVIDSKQASHLYW
jgi:serine/tyrosine/threonine adenylyltransferase